MDQRARSASQRAWRTSEKGRAWSRAYRQRPDVKARHAERERARRSTEAGRRESRGRWQREDVKAAKAESMRSRRKRTRLDAYKAATAEERRRAQEAADRRAIPINAFFADPNEPADAREERLAAMVADPEVARARDQRVTRACPECGDRAYRSRRYCSDSCLAAARWRRQLERGRST